MADINTYEQLLLKTIFQLKFKLKELVRDRDFKEVAHFLDLDPRTIKKICTYPAHGGHLNCKDTTLDKMIHNLDLRPEIKTWRSFKSRFSPPDDIIDEQKEPIPDVAFEKLSDEWKSRIQLAVKEVMQKIFSGVLEKEIDWKLQPVGSAVPVVIDKLELYYNTIWHLYFYHEEDFAMPKIGRAVLEIGENRKAVKLINFSDSESNDYSGSVSLDKSQIVLIFDLKTTQTREKWLHMKVSINTGILPEIALGQYSNLGDGAVSLVSGTIILEYLPLEEEKELVAKPLGVSDTEFSEIHTGIRRYLRDKGLNYFKTKAQIFTKDKLFKFVNEYANVREKKSESVRLYPKMKVVITCPQTHLEPQHFEKYVKPCAELSRLLEEKLPFEVIHYPAEKYSGASSKKARSFKYFHDRIMECDILIIFYFDVVSSMCLMELAWAAEHNKAVYLFTVDFNMIPRVFQFQKPSSVQIYPGYSNPQEALDYIKREINYLFMNAITALQ